ncbi:MAG: sodium:proton antiporter [Planctomycetota bacterium]
MTHASHPSGSSRGPIMAIGALIAAYAVAAVFGAPQYLTEIIAKAQHAGHAPEQIEHPDDAHEAPAAAEGHADHAPPEHADESAAEAAEQHQAGHEKITDYPPLVMVVPFALLLGAIAVLPLIPQTAHWWESNLNRFLVAAVLAAITLAYYFFFYDHPIEGHWPAHHITHPNSSGPNWLETWDVFANAMLSEYVPFIVLLFSLYTISGGIRLTGDLPAHPLTNTVFLAIGAVLASIIGTTGAAMLLIRPLLETNAERKFQSHTVVFFIFVVCNCGGLLLPTGDPPLFLGYLMGVPFLWTTQLWPEYLFVNGCLLVIYYVWDRFWYYPHEEKRDIVRDETQIRPLRISGLFPNGLLLLGVILSVALLDPTKTLPGTDWHPWLYLRELIQLGLVLLSLALGDPRTRLANRFNYHAIIEVAALFFGIFICMQPALQILAVRGPNLGLTEPWHFFWATGSLSSFLDNAPTYVVFFKTAQSLTAAGGMTGADNVVAGVAEHLLIAISLGAVFMGANTYIGNGPNFMAKSIAESAGVKMPSFFGYMLYSCVFLIPLFVLTTFLFVQR